MKRPLEILVLSDIHLGTYGCQSKALLKYLKSVDPETIILNGDIVDIWQFNKRYFPKSHMKIIKYFLNLIQEGKTIYYLTGNHDEMLRRFNGFELKNFKILNKKVINLNGHKAWFFHGDVFDVSMKYSKWIAKLGGFGYDLLIIINSILNFLLIKIYFKIFGVTPFVNITNKPIGDYLFFVKVSVVIVLNFKKPPGQPSCSSITFGVQYGNTI